MPPLLTWRRNILLSLWTVFAGGKSVRDHAHVVLAGKAHGERNYVNNGSVPSSDPVMHNIRMLELSQLNGMQ